LSFSHGGEEVEGFDPCLEWLGDALAGERVGRLAVKRAEGAGGEGTFCVSGASQPIDNPADEGITDGDACGATSGDNFTACVNFLHFAKGHEEDAVIAKAYDFGLKFGEAVRADFTDVAERHIGAYGFDYEAGDLDDLTHAHDGGAGLDATPKVFHECWQNGGAVVHLRERATF
jgi:hypothetical protein